MARSDRSILALACGLAMALTLGCDDGVVDSTSAIDLQQVSAGVRPTGLTRATTRAQVRALSLAVASRAGVAAPPRMVAVAAADHQAAEKLIGGAIINDHSPVYVVQMSGTTFTSPHHPPGVPAPTGKFLTITYDAATLRITDIGYDDVQPDLGMIDAVVPVDLLAQ